MRALYPSRLKELSCNRKLYALGVLSAILYCLCLLFAVSAGILGVIAYWEVAERPLRSTAGILQLLGFVFALIAGFCTNCCLGNAVHLTNCSPVMLGWFLGDAHTADVPRPRIRYAQIIAFVLPVPYVTCCRYPLTSLRHLIAGVCYTFFQTK